MLQKFKKDETFRESKIRLSAVAKVPRLAEKVSEL